MKWFLAASLMLALLVPPAHAADTRNTWRANECRYQYVDGKAGWNVDEVQTTIRCVANRFDVSVVTALYIADRESNYRQFATNSSSGACGIFQHIPTYFPGRLHDVPMKYKVWGPSCYNARSNILAALWMAHRYGWGAWSM